MQRVFAGLSLRRVARHTQAAVEGGLAQTDSGTVGGHQEDRRVEVEGGMSRAAGGVVVVVDEGGGGGGGGGGEGEVGVHEVGGRGEVVRGQE